ncbi:M48 family metalloprotease [Paenibacillus sp. HJL G12]|uniref:M48 family metalloprotease n=1 Tax=Paenibacillus dendrobii TaxID=2691084 RepID=A0A7X3LHZ5_9BACL|nr:M56 family metallopeptidase [Paenibacillus dendrobii]MWV46386.1 M48 family metalloprotease [Paenibacillus dendrobii]
MNIAESLFRWFVASTLTASLVAIVVMAVQHLLRRRISARLRYSLWLIVLARLVLPVFPDSPVSLFNVFPAISDIKNAVAHLPSQQDKPRTETGNSIKENTTQSHYTLNGAGGNSQQQPVLQLDRGAGAAAITERENHPAIRILSVIWLAGTASFLAYHLMFWLRIKRKQKSFNRVSDLTMRNVAEECRRLFTLKRPVSLYMSPSIQSPYISGMIRPAVYLPETLSCDPEEAARLKHVIAHELAHYKRKDTAWNMLGSLVLAVHWMNPLVWMMMRRMKADRELACDACVLEVLGEEEAVPYGMTIIGYLKRYSSGRNHPHLLYFKGLNGEKDIVRRIRMIQSFKRGSYKFSVLAVLLVLLVGAATLTNAPVSKAGTSAWIHAEEGGDEMLFADGEFREYDNLEKAARVAPFRFKVPSVLPSGYTFDNISFHLQPLTSSASSAVNVRYQKAHVNEISGYMDLNIVRGAEPQQWYEQIRTEEEDLGDAQAGGKVIEKSAVSVNGLEGLKVTIRMTAWKGQPERYYYVWKDQGVAYKLGGDGQVTSRDFENMIASMKYPDENLNKLYENNDYYARALTYLFDTEDIRRAQKLIGYHASFPRKLPGDFAASGAYVSRKVNFNYPESDQDSMRMLLAVTYNPSASSAGVKRVELTQMLNGHMYEDMKKDRKLSLMRIDGKKFTVNLQPITIQGREVLHSEKFKIDGELSSPNETDRVSYFWLNDGVIFQARFIGQGSEEQSIVQYLMEQGKS